MRNARIGILALAVLLVLPLAGAAESRMGGVVVVGPNETVDGLQVFAGSVVVEGTVDGDLQVFAGDVSIDGTVNGDAQVFGGSVTLSGTVDGELEVAGGSIVLTRNAIVRGPVRLSGSSVTVEGTIDAPVALAGESVVIGDSAYINGDLTYDAGTFTNQGTVTGVVRHEELRGAPARATWTPRILLAVYWFLVSLLVGALLLRLFPGFADATVARAREEPVMNTVYGLAAVVAAPFALLLLILSIVGAPLAVLAAFLAVPVVVAATVYGAYVLGVVALERMEREGRWRALLLGVAVWSFAGLVPAIGPALQLLLTLLALGAGGVELVHRFRARR